MKQFYIAAIVPEKTEDGGGYSVYFPDAPNVAAGGETVHEAISNATSGLYLALRALAAQGSAIPEPSSLEIVRDKAQAEREADDLPFPENVVYQYISAPELDTVPVRINVSLSKSLLSDLDETADQHGMTRSRFIAVATQEHIIRMRA